MVDHKEEEELLEIGILLLLLPRQNRKARKVPTPRKRNVWVRKVHLVQDSLLDLFLKLGDCLLYKQLYFRTASASFSSNSALIFFLRFYSRTGLCFRVFPLTGKLQTYLCLCFCLCTTGSHIQHTCKHKHKHKKMEKFPFSYANAYAYVVPVHTYNSYACAYVTV